MRKLKKGFTLVELVIVIAVIAVLTAVLVPTFIHLTKKAKDASDKTVVKNANIQLAAQEATEGKNKSMHDAVLDVKEIGYHMPTVQTGNENKILWDKINDRFVLVDKKNKVLQSDAGVSEGNTLSDDAKLDYFYAVDDLGKRDGYSVYALGKSILDTTGESPVVNIAGFGFDAGDIGERAEETEDDKKFTINVGNSSKSILVATSSVSTNVHVDAEDGTVTHAGIAGKEQIDKINTSSFHETGRVGFIEMGEGHFVAESSAEIKALWFSDSDATYDKKSGAVVTEYAGSEAIKAAVGLDSGTAVREEIIVSSNKTKVEEDAVDELKREVNPVTAVEVTNANILGVFSPENTEYILAEDVNSDLLPITVPAGCVVHLDMNGHSITTHKGVDFFDYVFNKSNLDFITTVSCFVNYGTLTLTGEGNVGGPKGWFGLFNKGNLVLDGPSIHGGSVYFEDTGVTVQFDAFTDDGTTVAEGYVVSGANNELYYRP